MAVAVALERWLAVVVRQDLLQLVGVVRQVRLALQLTVVPAPVLAEASVGLGLPEAPESGTLLPVRQVALEVRVGPLGMR